MMHNKLEELLKIFNEYVDSISYFRKPKNLYYPIKHILSLKGKKIRPLISLLVYRLLANKIDDKILYTSVAIEFFHNFTLIHDDIIDNSDYRRGEETVNKKYGVNSGILSGDTLMILAYKQLENLEPKYISEILKIFNKIAIGICEGQQMDINFEDFYKISMEEYFKMIELKTSILIGLSFQLPAILTDKNDEVKSIFFEIGKNLGIVYQIQDDYLDTYGNFEKFGKPIGNDIYLNKKTFLSTTAFNDADEKEKNLLLELQKEKIRDKKLTQTLKIFETLHIKEKTMKVIGEYYSKINNLINDLDIINEKKKEFIKFFINQLIEREV